MYLFEYKELIINLVTSELKTKYSGSILGFAWSLINPLLMMLVLYFVFRNMYKDQSDLILYLLVGILMWRFFASSTTLSIGSIVGRSSLVTKIYIPREVLTLSSVLSSLISSLLEFSILIPLIVVLNHTFPLTLFLYPLLHLLFFVSIYGLALLLSSLYVYFRDLNQIWDVLVQILFFASPVIYPLTIVPPEYLGYYMLNPLTRMLDMYRDIFLKGSLPQTQDVLFMAACGIVLFAAGSLVFNRLSRRFAEEI